MSKFSIDVSVMIQTGRQFYNGTDIFNARRETRTTNKGVRIIGHSSKLLGRLKGSWRREEVKHSKIKKGKKDRKGEGRVENEKGQKRDDGVNSTLYRRPPSPLSPCVTLLRSLSSLWPSLPQHSFFYTPFNRSGSTT